jgi:DNA-binding LytR/AlgR family response regulator
MATILLIDDDEFLREALSELLRHESYTVVVAEGGAQGLVAARQHLPDLILCDLMMPGLDGHGVLRALRQEEALAELPVIFLTALSRHEDRRQGMDLGADDYLVKPVSKQDLKRAIEARLAKRDQARLAQERKVNVFIQSLSSLLHDLRGPLAALMSCALPEAAHQDSPSPWPRGMEGHFRHLLATMGRFRSWTDELMLYTRARFQLTPFHPVQLLAQSLFVQATAELPEAHRVQLNCDPPALQLIADPHLLRHALANLVGNALKYSPPETPVHVAMRQDEESWVITVRDAGAGLSPSDLPRLFEPFYRGEGATLAEGHGLGLAIARHAVEHHGGTLVAANVPTGGALFTITLPVLAILPVSLSPVPAPVSVPVSDPAPLPRASVSQLAPSSLCRVLLVEDEPLSRNHLAGLLEAYPNVIMAGQAASLAEARALAKTQRFDLALIDIHLPDGLGTELVRDLGVYTRVAFVSAYEEYAVKVFQHSPLGYLIKPVEAEPLNQVLVRFAENRRLPAGNGGSQLETLYRKLNLSSAGQRHVIQLFQIVMVRAYGECSTVFLTSGKFIVIRKSLRNWAKELPHPFFARAHRSVIINLGLIEQITSLSNRRLCLSLRHQEPLIASARLAPALKKALSEFINLKLPIAPCPTHWD